MNGYQPDNYGGYESAHKLLQNNQYFSTGVNQEHSGAGIELAQIQPEFAPGVPEV